MSARPLFLLLDGHSTHYQPQVIRFAKEHNCIILCLAPHTTHEAQPLDVGVFGPLKVQWTKVCHEFYQKNPGSVVTRFNFSHLFSQAWCKSVTPGNVMAGFRRAGVYPFNPNAITLTEDTSADTCSSPSRVEVDTSHQTSSMSAADETASVNNAATTVISCTATVSSQCLPGDNSVGTGPSHSSPTEDTFDRTLNTAFSDEREERFERRYQEGYDLPDPLYEEWLKRHHPESSQATLPPLPSEQELSLSEQFAEVSPLTPVAVNISKTSDPSSSSSITPSRNTPVLPSRSTPVLLSSGSSGRERDDLLSKHLVVPSASTPAGPKKVPPRARLLTSSAVLEILEEKELKKKRELELKEQKKREREENKRKREEDRKQKMEERARKAEEKAKQREQKTEEKARKMEKNIQKTAHTSSSQAGALGMYQTRSGAQPPSKKARVADENIDESRCCVCFTTYEEDVLQGSGKDWVMCACTRWLHEECAEDCVLDSTGKERLCPLCLDLFVV